VSVEKWEMRRNGLLTACRGSLACATSERTKNARETALCDGRFTRGDTAANGMSFRFLSFAFFTLRRACAGTAPVGFATWNVVVTVVPRHVSNGTTVLVADVIRDSISQVHVWETGTLLAKLKPERRPRGMMRVAEGNAQWGSPL
jgi:hypothetical protein